MKDTIIKRDGTREAYNEAKILNAVLRAAYDSTGVNNGPDLAIEVTNDVRNEMEQNPDKEYNVEEIQDLVEKHLMLSGKTDVAKQYILYRDKRTKAREKGWDLDEVGKKSYEEKYRHAGENFDEFIERISNGNKKIAKLLREKKFVFGGRILSNRGLQDEGYKVTYSNCYVLKGPEDNLESIFDVNRDMAITFSRGGGVGFDLSRLRPKDEPVHNNARTTSGPCSFMDIYNKTTQTIGQKGRRGALMLAMRVSHPDIQEFIDLKRQLGEIECANLSVMIDDKFMEAVIGGKSYLCKFKYDDGREVLKMVNANELFTRMCENSCDYAEPGLLFWDTVDRGGLLAKDPEFSYECVNPCLTGDTMIQTIEGAFPIASLVGTNPFVYCMDEYGKLVVRQASKVWLTRKNAELVEVDFGRGKIRCTPDHQIYTRNRGWVKAIELQPGDKLNGLGFSKGNEINEMVKLTSDPKYYRHHRFIMEQMGHDTKNKDVHHLDGNHLNNRYSNLQVLDHGEHSRLSNLGHGEFCPRDEQTGQFVAQTEHMKRTSNGNVNKENSYIRFEVRSVTKLDIQEDVYDMTVDGVHNFVANNIIVHNCAEEVLPAGGSCLLGHMNLSEFVVHPFTEGAYFDYDKYEEAVKQAVIALNEVLDEGESFHPLDYQIEAVRKYRQIGLGYLGIADMLIKLGIKYGSIESLQICDRIGFKTADMAIRTSAEIAKDKGTYETYNKEYVFASPFFKSNTTALTREMVRKYGLRNSQLLTCAPTGTVSLLYRTSGGIEPIFALKSERKTLSLNNGEEVKYEVNAKIVQDFMDIYGEMPIEDLPDYFVTAADIDYKDRVRFQAIWQKHIDASISSTVNLPHETSIEDIKQLFIFAWESGLKGITVYRAGCAREGILVNKDGKKDESNICPECGEELQHVEGCVTCMNCGYSKCS